MKNKLFKSFLVAALVFVSASSFAQKSVAYLTSKDSRHVVDNRLITITFQLSNVADEATKAKYLDSFKKYQTVTTAKADLAAGNKANFSVTLPKAQSLAALQKMFTIAGIETVNLDGKDIPTSQMIEYSKNKKAAQTKK